MEDKIEINGVSYVREAKTDADEMRIVIVDNRGLTFIGRCSLGDPLDGEWTVIKKARCVIRWGTSEHLAELVDGPLPNTKLGKACDVTVRTKNIVASYLVGDKWHE